MPVAAARGLRLVAITVVEVPQQLPIHEGLRFSHHKEPLLRAAREYGAEHGITIDTDLVIAHKVQDGLLQAAGRHRADLLVMGWKGFTNTRDRIFGEVADHIIRHAPCDLMVFKIEGQEFRIVPLPHRGRPQRPVGGGSPRRDREGPRHGGDRRLHRSARARTRSSGPPP